MTSEKKSMFKKESLEEIEKKKAEWEEGTLKETLKRFGAKEKVAEFYTPVDLKNYDFMEKIGFPGEYPFTAGIYASPVPGSTASMGSGFQDVAPGLVRAGSYSGYGTPKNTRDFYQNMISMGQKSGPNLAFDLPTQCGLDSDHPEARGEVGGTGVAVDTLMDFEIIYQAFLWKIKQERDNQKVQSTLKRLKEAAQDNDVNLIPPVLEAVKAYATVGEICDVLKEVFGEYSTYGAI